MYNRGQVMHNRENKQTILNIKQMTTITDGKFYYAAKLFTTEAVAKRLAKNPLRTELPQTLTVEDFNKANDYYGVSRLALVSHVIQAGYTYANKEWSLEVSVPTSNNEFVVDDLEDIEDARDAVIDDLEGMEAEVEPEQFVMEYVIESELKQLKKANKKLIEYATNLKQIADTSSHLKAPKFVKHKEKPAGTNRKSSAILQLSDLHFGSIIPEEAGISIGYNPELAVDLMHSVVNGCGSFIDEKNYSLPVEELVISLNGDIMEILNHGQNQLEITEQIILAQDILFTSLSALSKLAPKTRVYVTSGNHDRLESLKRVPTDNRFVRSYMNLIANNLAKYLPNIEFYTSPSYHCWFNVQSMRVVQFHGDSIKGGAGVGGITPSLMRYAYRLNQKQQFDLALMGHFHSSQLIDGRIAVNGCLSGDTAFTNYLALKSDRCQNLLFVDNIYGLNQFNRIWLPS
jgi:hypothetical protein